jgi:hypothetical protein
LLEFNQRVFVYEDGSWAAKGHYETALEDNNDISWMFDELDTLHLLIVSKQLLGSGSRMTDSGLWR